VYKRQQDNYGRENSGYEDIQHELPKTEDCVWIDDTKFNQYFIGSSTVTVMPVDNLSDLEDLKDDDIIAFIRGGLIKVINRREHLVTMPGDVGHAKVVKHVAKQMDAFAEDSVIMVIQKQYFNQC
jgi:hypothetical protein